MRGHTEVPLPRLAETGAIEVGSIQKHLAIAFRFIATCLGPLVKTFQ